MVKYYNGTTVWWYGETTYMVKWRDKFYGEMVNLPQCGYG